MSSDSCTKSNWETHDGSYIPLSILNNSITSPRYLLYFNVGRFNAFNLSLYDFLTVLELILWLFSVHVPVYQYQFFFSLLATAIHSLRAQTKLKQNEKTETEWTSVNEAVDSAKSGPIASHGVWVKAHGQRLSRRVELLHRQRRDVAAQLVAPRCRRRQRVRRIHVQVQTQVVVAPVARNQITHLPGVSSVDKVCWLTRLSKGDSWSAAIWHVLVFCFR